MMYLLHGDDDAPKWSVVTVSQGWGGRHTIRSELEKKKRKHALSASIWFTDKRFKGLY